MQAQGIALWRWLSAHRREITLAVALVVIAATLALIGPVLLVIGAVEWKRGRKRLLGVALAGLLFRAAVWLWLELDGAPHGRWHPCAQCGTPIEEPSRAWYCSPTCRRYAGLERDAHALDPWLARRALKRLERLSAPTVDLQSNEVPF